MTATRVLRTELDLVRTGEHWREYLSLAELESILKESLASETDEPRARDSNPPRPERQPNFDRRGPAGRPSLGRPPTIRRPDSRPEYRPEYRPGTGTRGPQGRPSVERPPTRPQAERPPNDDTHGAQERPSLGRPPAAGRTDSRYDRGRPAEPDREQTRRNQLAQIARRFEEVGKEADYEIIATRPGFQTVLNGLREYLLPPDERQSHVLLGALKLLDQSLDRRSTGSSWKSFLLLEELKELAASSQAWNAAGLDQLDVIATRFNAVRKDARYEAVAQDRGFKGTYDAMTAFRDALAGELVSTDPLPLPPR